jgi:hypothetical protein
LSLSGRQLFCIDKFRDTGKPLLAVLADPKSIFMQGLAKFKRRTLYANIINDRSAVYYTTGISKTDPYTDLSRVKVNYLKGCEDVILDLRNPVEPLPVDHQKEKEALSSRAQSLAKSLPFFLAMGLFLPIGVVALVITGAVQSFRSAKRIQMHEKGLAGVGDVTEYRSLPFLLKEIRNQIEDAYEELNSTQRQEYLSAANSDDDDDDEGLGGNGHAGLDREDDQDDEEHEIVALERKQSQAAQPTLALTGHQFAMISALDNLGWRKYPVWIHKARHSHAAIIVRMDRESFSEGEIVLGHWVKEEFLI